MLHDSVYEGRRLPFASLQDLKEAIKNKWKHVTIETVRKFIAQWKTIDAVRKQNGGAIQHILLIAVTGYRSHVVRQIEFVIFYSSDIQYSFAYFTVKTKAYNVIISHIVQL